MNEKKVASLETWKALGDDGQAEIALKAAKRATYIARCYGVELYRRRALGQDAGGHRRAAGRRLP